MPKESVQEHPSNASVLNIAQVSSGALLCNVRGGYTNVEIPPEPGLIFLNDAIPAARYVPSGRVAAALEYVTISDDFDTKGVTEMDLTWVKRRGKIWMIRTSIWETMIEAASFAGRDRTGEVVEWFPGQNNANELTRLVSVYDREYLRKRHFRLTG